MGYKFYDELETMASYPLALLEERERARITSNFASGKDPIELLDEKIKRRIAQQIDTFFEENQQMLHEHIHEVRIFESLYKLKERCDTLGIPWEKLHIIKTIKRGLGKLNAAEPLLFNLPSEYLLPLLLCCAENFADLKRVAGENERMKEVMYSPHAIQRLCSRSFYEWGISGEIAADFLSEFATHVENLQVDFSFCQDLTNDHLRKMAKSCANIAVINLSGCAQIDDEGIQNFSTNHHLKHLYCFDCPKISKKEQAILRELLPNCIVYG